MYFQGIITNLFLPPIFILLIILLSGLFVCQRQFFVGALVVICTSTLLFLSTPYAAGTLSVALEQRISERPAADIPQPAAIIVLGGDIAHGEDGPEVGPLTLERLRTAAALHRSTGLPVLVTGGPLSGRVAIADLMAASLSSDFSVPARWIERRARDTRENAVFSVAIMREANIGAAFIVSHAWHLPRSQAAFMREGFSVVAAPVRRGRMPSGIASDWVPRPDHLTRSWYALREWAGLLIYRIRDGSPVAQ